MTLVAVGLNHHTSPVELREQIAFSAKSIPSAVLRLRKRLNDAGIVILSTCNRVELYVHHPGSAENLFSEIREFLCDWHNIAEKDFTDYLYEYEGEEVVRHLFRVTASLDSLVVGEAQILGQVHDAYLVAQTEQAADRIIHQLFQKAFSIAKTVRTQTEIGSGKVSVSSVAVDLAASIFMELSGKTVLVIGSGEMGELTLKSLVERGVGTILVTNRSPERAAALAEMHDGEAIPYEHLHANLYRADIVISSTAAPHYVLHPSNFQEALKQRNYEPMFVIDIAVPRDVEPACGELNNVYLYNVDDLQKVMEENIDARRKEIDRSMAIVDRGVEQFMRWMHGLAAEPTLASISEEIHAIRERELQKTLAALPDLTEKQRQEITYLSDRIVRSILHRPLSHIKQEIGHHDPKTVLHLVKRFFGLEES